MIQDIEIINTFEEKIAKYAGSKYGVAIDSGTNAFFLSLLYLKKQGILKDGDTLTVPSRTYLSIPMTIKNAGLNVKFKDIKWKGCYQIKPTNIFDSAVRFTKNMYISNSIYILSFQYRKHIPIGRGGMILTNDKKMVDWLKMARFNGKHLNISRWEDKFEILGWDMYMTSEQASRGLLLLNNMNLKEDNPDCGCYKDYPDLSKQEVFK
jgi:dTDP-4-amino-4,6-dideoxygalactose transaminase